MIAFEAVYRILFFVHFAAAIVVAGSVVHLIWRLGRQMVTGKVNFPRARTHATILAVGYVICFTFGAMVYPAFRVRVVRDHFESGMHWAIGLFEAKEHLASVGLAAVLGLLVLAWALPRSPDERQRRVLPLFAGLVAVLLVVIGYTVWSGWYLTALKGV
jgi:hypothetical protein